MMDLYKNIRQLREQKNMSQGELAKLTGYTSRSSIAKIEKGDVDLPQSKIIAFANALGTTPGKLMGLTDADLRKEDSTTIAAHFDGEEFTEEQWNRIEAFAKFIKQEDK